jgi:hypothetical protein
MDNMKAEAGTALIPAGREERIESLAPDIEVHAATVVGKNNLDAIIAGGFDLDVDVTCLAAGKRMHDREEQVGRNCPYGPG